MVLYFIRHGETSWNVEGKMQGQTDIPLNENGIRLAEETAEGMKEIPFDLCITSPLSRARQTAEIVLGGRKVPIIEDARIEELSFGNWEGIGCRPENYAVPTPIEEFQKFYTEPFAFVPGEGGETILQLCKRTKEFWDEVTAKPEYEDKLEGLVLFDPMPFDGIENIDDLTLREAAVWGCIYNIQETQGGFDNYNTDPDTEQLLLPSLDVDAYLAKLLGPGFKLTHRSFEMEDMTIEFDDATQCYKIPVTGTVGYYRAVVTKLFKRSGKLHVTVGYIPTTSTDDSIINVSSDTPTKYMDYLFERQSGSWYLTGLTESETKAESTESTPAANVPEPMAESDVQDAILELCVDVFLLHIAHVETTCAGAGEGFAPQIATILILFVIAVAAHCLNGQVAVVQIHLNVFLLAARQVNRYFVAVVRLFDIGLHHVCTALTKGITSLTVHHTFQCSVIPERIEEIIEQVFMENSRHKHKSFLQSRRSGRGKKSEASIQKGFPGSLAALLLPFLLSTPLL